MLQNVQLTKTGYKPNATVQGHDYNVGSIAFTSFIGINHVDHTQSLCLLSFVSNWDNTWIVDTGASDHICHNEDLFFNIRVLTKSSMVTLPNGKRMTVTHASTIIVNHTLALYGVLYIPNFKYNLLSVSKLTSQYNYYVIFTPQCCFMQAPSTRRPQVLGKHYVGLYLL